MGKSALPGTGTAMVPDVTPGETREQRWERRLQVPMLIASLAVIPLVIIAADDFSPEVERIGRFLNWGTWLMFVGEIVLMLAITDNRRRWLRTHPAELIATILSPPILPGPLQTVRFLRVLRLARLAVTVKHLRRFITPAGLRDSALLTAFIVLAGGVAFSQVERSQHLSAWDGVWWAMSTITTVGYGDVTPHTVAGRLIAIVMMVSGVAFVALLTAAVAERFIRDEQAADMSIERHLVNLTEELRQIRRRLDRLEAGAREEQRLRR
ncbi:MAG TPA: ion channel [Gaiellales bacterium]|nr:ion channel [Gaiellales bacterium]